MMNVLIACEFSGVVRDAFRARGHNAWSCDLLGPDDVPARFVNRSDYHWQGDVLQFIHFRWDLMIAHPPCTHLAVSGARWWKDKVKEQNLALTFVRILLDADIPRIALENPVGKISTAIRQPDQYIQPWQFGHGETKKTGLWLKNLPLLKPTNIVDGREGRVWKLSPSKDRWLLRSITYQGIANAMADQWNL